MPIAQQTFIFTEKTIAFVLIDHDYILFSHCSLELFEMLRLLSALRGS